VKWLSFYRTCGSKECCATGCRSNVLSVFDCAVKVSVEAHLEQPFFVHGAGWSSCDPARTHARYQLTCRQLSVGDTCISLTTGNVHVTPDAAAAAAAAGQHCCHLPALFDNSRSVSRRYI